MPGVSPSSSHGQQPSLRIQRASLQAQSRERVTTVLVLHESHGEELAKRLPGWTIVRPRLQKVAQAADVHPIPAFVSHTTFDPTANLGFKLLAKVVDHALISDDNQGSGSWENVADQSDCLKRSITNLTCPSGLRDGGLKLSFHGELEPFASMITSASPDRYAVVVGLT